MRQAKPVGKEWEGGEEEIQPGYTWEVVYCKMDYIAGDDAMSASSTGDGYVHKGTQTGATTGGYDFDASGEIIGGATTARSEATAATNGGATTLATGGGETTTEISSEVKERKSVTQSFVDGEWVTTGAGDVEAKGKAKTEFRIHDSGGLYIETEMQDGTRTIESELQDGEWVEISDKGKESGSRS